VTIKLAGTVLKYGTDHVGFPLVGVVAETSPGEKVLIWVRPDDLNSPSLHYARIELRKCQNRSCRHQAEMHGGVSDTGAVCRYPGCECRGFEARADSPDRWLPNDVMFFDSGHTDG